MFALCKTKWPRLASPLMDTRTGLKRSKSASGSASRRTKSARRASVFTEINPLFSLPSPHLPEVIAPYIIAFYFNHGAKMANALGVTAAELRAAKKVTERYLAEFRDVIAPNSLTGVTEYSEYLMKEVSQEVSTPSDTSRIGYRVDEHRKGDHWHFVKDEAPGNQIIRAVPTDLE
jgi:hypothetical protein